MTDITGNFLSRRRAGSWKGTISEAPASGKREGKSKVKYKQLVHSLITSHYITTFIELQRSAQTFGW